MIGGHMNKTLLTTSIFSAIFDEEKKDYLDLIIPFAEYIFAKKYKKMDKISLEEVHSHLEKEFYFRNLPINVVHNIFVRLRKRDKLKKEHGDHYLVYDFKDEEVDFNTKKANVSNTLKNVVKNLRTFLINDLDKSFSLQEVETCILSFVDNFGYDTYFSIDNCKNIPANKNQVSYSIGKYIRYLHNHNHIIEFNEFMQIIEGFMITDAVYLQVDIKNKKFFSNLTVYIDGPLLLRVLGLKSKFENLAAKQLIDLLKKFKTTIRVFSHTRDEVVRILTFYMHNKHKGLNDTIEYFDNNNYSVQEVFQYLNEIDKKIKNKGISIIERPDFSEKYTIDEEALNEKLVSNRPEYLRDNLTAVETDINSVRSIHILRNGKNYQRFEECDYIFVTTYKFLKYASDLIRDDNLDKAIGPVITDIDFTTILWMKDITGIDDLPRLKLLENAMAAIEPSSSILNKTRKILNNIKNETNEEDELWDKLTIQYLLDKDYIDRVKNDEELVNEEFVKKIINEDENEIHKLKEKNKKLENNISNYHEVRLNEIETKGKKVFFIMRYTFLSLYYSSILLLGLLLYLLPNVIMDKLIFSSVYLGIIVIINIIIFIIDHRKLPFSYINKISHNIERKFIERQQTKLKNELKSLSDKDD
jgi:hypothetical protein